MGQVIDMSGRLCGRLFVLRSNGFVDRHVAWLCVCECGTLVTIKGTDLRRNVSSSCGCYRRESTGRTGRANAKRKTAQHAQQEQP